MTHFDPLNGQLYQEFQERTSESPPQRIKAKVVWVRRYEFGGCRFTLGQLAALGWVPVAKNVIINDL